MVIISNESNRRTTKLIYLYIMKDLIKNILLEQTGVVPPDSWPGESYIGRTVDGSSWAKQSITKVMFFKAVKLLVKHNSWDEIVEFTEESK